MGGDARGERERKLKMKVNKEGERNHRQEMSVGARGCLSL